MNTNFWSTLTKYDKRKLIYAYIISPLIIILSLGGKMQSAMYRQYGEKALGEVPCGLIFGIGMMTYLPLVLPATIIRFGYFKRSLTYGLELYYNMVLSVFLSSFLVFLMTGFSQGILGTLAVYCILSYRSTGYNDIYRNLRYTLTFITLAAPFVVMSMLPEWHYFPIWEGVFISIMLNCHLPPKSEKLFSQSSAQYTPPPHEPPHEAPHYEPPHTEQREDTTNNRHSTAIKLVKLGLACIGRTTKHSNIYFTSEREAERKQAEYTFLRQVAEKYRDTSARKVIARHFMLYKECCLYIIYSVVLKGEPELHRLVKDELTELLTDGLTTEAKVRRNEYMYAFSRAFYEEYQDTKSRHKTLSFMFWSVLCIKHPELVSAPELSELISISGLSRVYRYTQEALEAAIKTND